VAALDYASRNIRVNAVVPGPMLTHRLAAVPEEYRQAMARSVPLLRPSEAGIAAGIGETGIGVTVVLLRHVRPHTGSEVSGFRNQTVNVKEENDRRSLE
jgi:NAD(P)-dependent dehydrogenase (short-subunit alcohol dehydrogenase family)